MPNHLVRPPSEARLTTEDAHRLAASLVAENPPATIPPIEFLEAQFDRGLAWIHFPPGAGGLGADRVLQRVVDGVLRTAGAPDPTAVSPIAHRIVAPIIVEHGSPHQQARLRPLFTGQERYCQLFSEPGAGSDLAAIATRAVARGHVWRVTGQKVWSSGAHRARWGLLLVRTGPAERRHRALTLFLLDMQLPGIEVRPLVQITGEAEFNEVFLDDVELPDTERLGPVDAGWTVAMATLAEERTSIGTTRMYAGGDVVDHALHGWRERRDPGATMPPELIDVVIRRRVLEHTVARCAADESLRDRLAPVLKLASSELTRRAAEVLLHLQGAAGMLHADGYRRTTSEVVYRYESPTQFFLRTRAATIGGGTSEILRNLIAERSLGLPR